MKILYGIVGLIIVLLIIGSILAVVTIIGIQLSNKRYEKSNKQFKKGGIRDE